MTIFKYEMRRHRKYVLGWAVTLAVCILLMTPTYYGFLDAAESSGTLFDTLGNSDFYKSVGGSIDFLTAPMGMYGFLTSFFMIAAGIFGMHFGISIHTSEFVPGTCPEFSTISHFKFGLSLFLTSALTVNVDATISVSP